MNCKQPLAPAKAIIIGPVSIRAPAWGATTASTMLHELGFDHAHIEKQLAHEVGNSVSAVYNHAEYLQQRREMMQAWSDFLDQLRGK